MPICQKTDSGLTIADFCVHTYRDREMALLEMTGLFDNNTVSADIWVTEDEVRAIRNALNEALGESNGS
jgi:hypothetical protein